MKTASGATAVQIVYSSHRGSRDIEHIGSAHDDAGLELLKAAARRQLAAGQGELDLGLDAGATGGPLPVTASPMGCLLDALSHAYDVLGTIPEKAHITESEPGVCRKFLTLAGRSGP